MKFVFHRGVYIMKILCALFFLLWPILGYTYGTFFLTDPQGIRHEVSMQMMLVEHGQLLSDGDYITPAGIHVLVKGGQIVINATQDNALKANPVNAGNKNKPVHPLQQLSPSVIPLQNTIMNVQPGSNTLHSPPSNSNVPTMNKVEPTAPSQQPGAPGL